jgi:hypothetical protein
VLFDQAQPYIVCCPAGWKIGAVLALDDLYASKVSVDLLLSPVFGIGRPIRGWATKSYRGNFELEGFDRNASLDPAELKRQWKLTKLEKDTFYTTNNDHNSLALSFESWNKVNDILFHGLVVEVL